MTNNKKSTDNTEKQNIEYAGTVTGSVGTTNNVYGMNKFNTPRGHGFAAERANHLADILRGKDARIVGDNNAKHGADRLVDGIEIQSKYCKTGSKCISQCFENQQFKYFTSEGDIMQIEVPSDKYNDALKAMQERIKKGQVKGINDPAKAKEIIKKGNFTYEQVRNIAKFGTVESLVYDAVNGTIISVGAFGVSSIITFATSIWSGESHQIAIQNALYSGLKVSGVTFVTSIISSQLARTGLNSTLRGTTDFMVKKMGSKISAQIANSFRSGSNIYGAAAMNNVSKLLRGNIVTGAVTVAVISSLDVTNIFRRRISARQLFKNVSSTTTGVAGGTAGWIAGATGGAVIGSVIPIVGTAIGGVVGGVLGAFGGGTVASSTTKKIMDKFIDDDAKVMLDIIEKEFLKLTEKYLLNDKEVEKIVDLLKDKLKPALLKDMYSHSDKREFAMNLLKPIIESIVSKRDIIKPINEADMLSGLNSSWNEENEENNCR